MQEKRIITKSSQETFDFGKHLGEAIDFPLIIFLQGQMGAGKTLFSKGFVAGMGIDDEVTSPTYTLVNEYGTPLEFFILICTGLRIRMSFMRWALKITSARVVPCCWSGRIWCGKISLSRGLKSV